MPGIFSSFWFVQGIGAIGLLFSIIAFQMKDRKSILGYQSVSAVFFVFHFLLLSAYVGAGMNIIVAIRNFVAEKKNRAVWAGSLIWPYIFSIASVVVLLFLKQGWVSILPVIGVIGGTIAVWKNKSSEIRLYMLLSGLVWIPYTIIVHSYPGLVTQLIGGIALLAGMYRLDRKKN
jgi:hypothetical protein